MTYGKILAVWFAAVLITMALLPLRFDHYGGGLLPAYAATQTPPRLEYSLERTAPLEIAKVFGRSKGCQDAGPDIIGLIARSAIDANLDPKLAASVVDQESGCDPLAVSSRGALGLMQVMPKVWKTRYDFSRVNLLNVNDNTRIGTQILSGLVRQYGEKEALERYQGIGPQSNPDYTSQVLGRVVGDNTGKSTSQGAAK